MWIWIWNGHNQQASSQSKLRNLNQRCNWACKNQAIPEVMEFIHIPTHIPAIGYTVIQIEEMLSTLVSNTKSRKIIASNFKAWAADWGSRSTNTRSRISLETFAKINLVLTNTEMHRGRDLTSIVHLTYVTTTLTRRIFRYEKQRKFAAESVIIKPPVWMLFAIELLNSLWRPD